MRVFSEMLTSEGKTQVWMLASSQGLWFSVEGKGLNEKVT